MSSPKNLLRALGVLVAGVAWFELTPTDLWVQQALFDRGGQGWILDNTEPLARLLFYDGPKGLLILLALCLTVSLLFIRRSRIVRRYASGIRIVLLSLVLIPACVAAMKDATNVACPRQLAVFGGDLPYVGVVDSYLARSADQPKLRCFPAAHASGGFALLSLFFLFKTLRNRRRALYAALAVGWAMGAYKIAIGDHFLSHTVASMLFAWLGVCAIALAESSLGQWLRQPEGAIDRQIPRQLPSR